MKTILYLNRNSNLHFFFLFNLLLVLCIVIPKSSFAFVENTVAISIMQIDSTEEDTIVYTTGDTVAIYTSGLDSVYITYAEAIPDSIMENLWVINNPHKQMIVELSHQNMPVNEGVIGINLTDFFEPNKANFDANFNYTKVPDPWQAVADLAPKTLRIFSGASAKFMHPSKPFYDFVNEVTYGGYGYDWTEIISYFDATEPLFEAPTLFIGEYDFEAIFLELEGGEISGCGTGDCLWVDGSAKKRMLEFFDECVSQPIFDPTDTDFDELDEQPMYINQFISLVNFIEAENPGHVVDVIYCVNIESMSASEMMEVISYLMVNDINIVGVELGNESYNKLGQLAMGFIDFDHYWKYINSVDYTDTEEQEALDFALADDVEEDHDFIHAIKDNSSIEIYSIKIGLPAINTPKCGRSYDFPLFAPEEEDENDSNNEIMYSGPILTDPDLEFEDEDCDCFYPDWNLDMVEHYGDLSYYPVKYLFDAIIFHPYYNTTNTTKYCEENSNWRDIMLQLHPSFDPDHLSDEEIIDYVYSDSAWDYVDVSDDPSIDTRLEKAFFEITGIHYPLEDDDLIPGNFKEFTRDRIDNSFEEHAAQMLFTHDDDGPESKEVWLTEYNLDDGVYIQPFSPPELDFSGDNEEIFQDFESSVSNSFAHAAMLQNWMLWNIKASYDNDYKLNFLTRATLQNALGGTKTMLMTNSDKADQFMVGEITSCTATSLSPYFIRRATYYAAEILNVISKKHLHYLKSTTTMASLNNNLAPSVFVDLDPVNQMLYIFYTNVSDEKQWFGIDPGSLISAFADPSEYMLQLNNSTKAVILDADQLYSTAGKTTLFSINDAYSTCSLATDVTIENRFELTGLENYTPIVTCPYTFETASPFGVCVELPPVSMG